jgi:hypothetical protein
LLRQHVLGEWSIPGWEVHILLPEPVATEQQGQSTEQQGQSTEQQGQSSDGTRPHGEKLTVGEVASRLATALREVKYVQKEGKKDPLGWVVAVDLDVSGLKGVPLLLTWSLDGLNVPDSWSADRIAYRLTATTAHDNGSIEVWVPDLKKRGSYNVNLKLAYESSGHTLTRASVEVPSR